MLGGGPRFYYMLVRSSEKVPFKKMTNYHFSGNYEFQLFSKNMSSFEN